MSGKEWEAGADPSLAGSPEAPSGQAGPSGAAGSGAGAPGGIQSSSASDPEPDHSRGDASPVGRPSAHPAPGTEAWERERVERLARTFRDTLRVLEQSLSQPQRPAASELKRQAGRQVIADLLPAAAPAEPKESPAITDRSAPELLAPAAEPLPAEEMETRPLLAERLEEPAAAAIAAPDLAPAHPAAFSVVETADSAPAVPPAAAPAAPLPAIIEGDLADLSRMDRPVTGPVFAPALERAIAEAATAQPAEARTVAPTQAALEPEAALAEAVSPPPMAAIVSEALPVEEEMIASPDVRHNIEEAALIRQRLPQHIAMLLRIPTNEVAQHSYKSPFRESREELIRRLLDPQLTLEEAARVLGVCPTTVRRYTNRGMLQCHRTPGNQRRFRMSDVLMFVEQFGDRIDRAAEAGQVEGAA